MDARSDLEKAKHLLDQKKLRDKRMKEMREDARWVICIGVILTGIAIGYGRGMLRIPDFLAWLGPAPTVSASNQDLKVLGWKIAPDGKAIEVKARNVSTLTIPYAEIHFLLQHRGGVASTGIAVAHDVSPGLPQVFQVASKLPIQQARLEKIRVR